MANIRHLSHELEKLCYAFCSMIFKTRDFESSAVLSKIRGRDPASSLTFYEKLTRLRKSMERFDIHFYICIINYPGKN